MLSESQDTERDEPQMLIHHSSEGNTRLALCIAGGVPALCIVLKFIAAYNGFPLELNEGALYAGYGMGIASILGYKVKEKLVQAKQKLDKAKEQIEVLRPAAAKVGVEVPDLTIPPKSG